MELSVNKLSSIENILSDRRRFLVLRVCLFWLKIFVQKKSIFFISLPDHFCYEHCTTALKLKKHIGMKMVSKTLRFRVVLVFGLLCFPTTISSMATSSSSALAKYRQRSQVVVTNEDKFKGPRIVILVSQLFAWSHLYLLNTRHLDLNTVSKAYILAELWVQQF